MGDATITLRKLNQASQNNAIECLPVLYNPSHVITQAVTPWLPLLIEVNTSCIIKVYVYSSFDRAKLVLYSSTVQINKKQKEYD